MITRNRTAPFVLIAALFWSGCGLLWHPGTVSTLLFGEGSAANPDKYHIGKHGWAGDSIYVEIYKTSDPSATVSLPSMTAECASCNFVRDPVPIVFDANRIGTVYIPETKSTISARLHILGSGIDTTFIQTQRSPEEADSYFHLSKLLIGRVLIERLALLYGDTSQDSVVASANTGDELNIYAENRNFFIVQDPNIPEPLYLLKSDAFRIE